MTCEIDQLIFKGLLKYKLPVFEAYEALVIYDKSDVSANSFRLVVLRIEGLTSFQDT